MGSTTDDRTARAAAWLAAWDRQGVHRTATKGDEAGADWLVAEAVGLGAAPTTEEFVLDRLDPVEAYLECGAGRIPGVPVFDAPATPDDGIAGTLGRDIAVVELSPRNVYDPTYEKMRREAPQRGLVIVSTGERPGLGLLNAERFRRPYGPPALQIASEARDTVLAAAARQAPGHLVATSRRTRTKARNVVVTIPGLDRNRAPVVVMTPRSSWWQSTAERGGGLVCWLESLRALLAAPPLCDVILTANSGPAGGGRWRPGVRSGSITAPTSVPLAANSRSSRRATICVLRPPPSWRAPAGRRTGSRQRHWCRAAKRATSTAPAGAT